MLVLHLEVWIWWWPLHGLPKKICGLMKDGGYESKGGLETR